MANSSESLAVDRASPAVQPVALRSPTVGSITTNGGTSTTAFTNSSQRSRQDDAEARRARQQHLDQVARLSEENRRLRNEKDFYSAQCTRMRMGDAGTTPRQGMKTGETAHDTSG